MRAKYLQKGDRERRRCFVHATKREVDALVAAQVDKDLLAAEVAVLVPVEDEVDERVETAHDACRDMVRVSSELCVLWKESWTHGTGRWRGRGP